MQSVLQILHVAPPRTGVTAKGKPWRMVDAECIVTRADGSQQVGVLLLPKELEAVKPGHYLGTFDLSIDFRDRRVGAQIVNLQPCDASGKVLQVGK